MAESAASELSDVACPVCLEAYSEPKALTCGHSLCAECARRLQQDNGAPVGLGGRSRAVVNCPQCRAITCVPVDGLPTNYSLADVLSRFAQLETGGGRRVCNTCQQRFKADQFWHCATCAADDAAQLHNCVCSRCGLRRHNGHAMVELVEMQRRKLAAVQTVATMREDAERELVSLQAASGRIDDTLQSIVQVLSEAATRRFVAVAAGLDAADVVGGPLLDAAVAEAQRIHDALADGRARVGRAQAAALAKLQLQECLGGLLSSGAEADGDDAESAGQQEVIIIDSSAAADHDDDAAGPSSASSPPQLRRTLRAKRRHRDHSKLD